MRSEARQAQILACAKKVFAELGYHAASVSHICAAAGIGRGTLYQYFRSKKDVFAAILRRTLARVEAAMASRQPLSLPPPETVDREQVIRWSARRLRALLAIAFEDEHILRILLREAVGLDASIDAIVGEIDDRMIGLVEAELVAARAAGLVRALDPRVTATAMVGGVEKLAITALRSEAPVELDALAIEVARLHGVGILSERVPEVAAGAPDPNVRNSDARAQTVRVSDTTGR